MKAYLKRMALSLLTGYILCYFGELMFWATPCREGMTIPGMVLTWLAYSFFAYVFLCVVSVFRVRSLWAVFLAGAFFGWYEEGIFVQTMYGSPDGPFPMSISFTGLAWHAIIDVCVGWLLVRRTLARGKFVEIAGLAVMIGIFYGLWAIFWWTEPPAAMQSHFAAGRPDVVFVHFSLFILSTTGILVFAYWLHNRLMPFLFRPTQGELWFLTIVTAAYYLLVTVPAAPKAIWVLPPLLAVTVLALYRNQRCEVRVDAISAYGREVKMRHCLLLFLIPLVAGVIYFIGLAAELRARTNIVVYYTFGIAGALFWPASVASCLLRKKRKPLAEPGSFNLWVFGDAHVGTDLKRGRESLADALRASERGGVQGGPPFDWDIAVDVGDLSGGQSVPEDAEGREVVRQFGALEQHAREAVYSVCGNHDRSGLSEPAAWWWQKWVDPMGVNGACSGVDAKKRPYPVEGTWERYAFRVGNILFLMMSDINEPTQKIGRGDLGGNPGGVVSGETFNWWKAQVEANPQSIIVTVHHYMLKDTTVASGEWEGMRKDRDGQWQSHYHGYKPLGSPRGASYLYFVDSKPDAQAFEAYLAAHPGAVAIWLGGHTHTHPDDTSGGKAHVEKKWGTWFINAACLSRYHGSTNVPMSRLLTFREGSGAVQVRCYMQTDEFLPQGWYAKAERCLQLERPFTAKKH